MNDKPDRPDRNATALERIELCVLGLRQDMQALRLDLHALATKSDLTKAEQHIMSAISNFADKVTAHNNRVDTAITGLQGDIQALKDEIAKLQSTQGQITPEDQALLDGIEARAATVADKLDALDALTPPPAPPTP